MPASVYRQDEISEMLIVEKTLVWSDQTKNRSGDETARVIPIISANSKYAFKLEIRRNRELGESNVILSAQMRGREFTAIARYDLEDSEHLNPDWFAPEYILPRIPHRHIYNQRAIEIGKKWDVCATPIEIQKHVPVNLIGQAISDLNMHFEDTISHGQLFGFMK